MESLEPTVILIIVVALAAGTFTKGITGVGLPILAMPLMAGFLGVERAVLIMMIPSFVSNIWLVITHRDQWAVFKRLRLYLAFAAVGGVLGSLVLVSVSPRILSLLLAVALGLYLLHQWRNPSFRLKSAHERLLAPLAGIAAGTIQGTSGISAPLIAPYYHAIGLAQRAYVTAISGTFLFVTIIQFAAVTKLGIYTLDRFYEGLIALVPVVIFLPLGMRMAKSISRETFDKVLLAVLIVMEIKLLYDAIWPV